MLNCHSVTGSSYTSKLLSTPKQAPQSWLILVYQAKIADLIRNVTVTWCKNLSNHSLSVSVENPFDNEHHCTWNIELKNSQFWNKKGLKNLEVDGKRVYFYWDFRQALFSGSPAPISDYYVAIVYEQEVVLLLGDLEQAAYNRIRRKPSLVEATLLCKKENVYGKNLFCTRMTLGEEKQEHDIIIENAMYGPSDPEMWISIDGIFTIHILNLHWRFRGNETISINNTSVQIYWDVHDWLFNKSPSKHALFIFNPTVECASKNNGDGKTFSTGNEGDCRFETTTKDNQSISGFCHILYAWKTE